MSAINPAASPEDGSRAIRAGMQLYYTLLMGGRLNVPTPVDLPQYRAGGNAWRVLLLGNGPTHGWGVFSHRFSLVGQLGLAYAEIGDRQVDIDYVGDELMTTETAVNWLQTVDIAAYDQVVVILGWNDAVRMVPQQQWRGHYSRILNMILARKQQHTSVILVGIEPLADAMGYAALPAKVAQPLADTMNAYMSESATTVEAAYVDLHRRHIDYTRPLGSSFTYRAWADTIAATAAPLLPRGEARIIDQALLAKNFNWVGSKLALGLGPVRIPTRIREIEENAKKAFGADLVQMTLLEDDKQWMLTHWGPTPQSVPRELTYCDVAVRQEEPLVVPNAKTDPRFKDNPYLDIAHMPFYVGTALKSRAGDVIGSFCVLGIVPRPKALVNMRKFQEHLNHAQAEIWRIEDEAVKLQSSDYDI